MAASFKSFMSRCNASHLWREGGGRGAAKRHFPGMSPRVGATIAWGHLRPRRQLETVDVWSGRTPLVRAHACATFRPLRALARKSRRWRAWRPRDSHPRGGLSCAAGPPALSRERARARKRRARPFGGLRVCRFLYLYTPEWSSWAWGWAPLRRSGGPRAPCGRCRRAPSPSKAGRASGTAP